MQALHRFALAVGLLSIPVALAHAVPQSPINLEDTATVNVQTLDAIQFTYGNAMNGLGATNEGANKEKDLRIMFPGGNEFVNVKHRPGEALVKYDLVNMHFHAHAEHTRNAGRPAMEIHFVHSTVQDDTTGTAGVNLAIGLWVNIGGASTILADIFGAADGTNSNIPAANNTYNMAAGFNLFGLIPASQKSWRYDGSLTTPHTGSDKPVKWIMLDTPITMTQAQVNNFLAKWPLPDGNYRHPVIALDNGPNGHKLTTDVPEPGCAMLIALGALVAARRKTR